VMFASLGASDDQVLILSSGYPVLHPYCTLHTMTLGAILVLLCGLAYITAFASFKFKLLQLNDRSQKNTHIAESQLLHC
jgi:hypothetical protein